MQNIDLFLIRRITPKNDFLRRTVTDVIERRRKEGVRGNDVIQVFIDMLDKGGADANAKGMSASVSSTLHDSRVPLDRGRRQG